jgi:hypothetical protein
MFGSSCSQAGSRRCEVSIQDVPFKVIGATQEGPKQLVLSALMGKGAGSYSVMARYFPDTRPSSALPI